MSGNPSVVNIVELTNSVTSVTGGGSDIGTLATGLKNIQQMVNFTDKTILADIVGKFATNQVNFQDPVNFKNNVSITGTLSLNGTSLSNTVTSTPVGNNSGLLLLTNLSGATPTTYYTNSFFFPDATTIKQNANLEPGLSNTYNLGSSTNIYSSIYAGKIALQKGSDLVLLSVNAQGKPCFDNVPLIQSGSSTTDLSGTKTVVFPTPYAAPPNVVATITGSDFGLLTIVSISNTSFTVKTSSITPPINATSYSFNWQASV